ncbi:unnamed protein product, partial [Mycena citricolor]
LFSSNSLIVREDHPVALFYLFEAWHTRISESFSKTQLPKQNVPDPQSVLRFCRLRPLSRPSMRQGLRREEGPTQQPRS